MNIRQVLERVAAGRSNMDDAKFIEEILSTITVLTVRNHISSAEMMQSNAVDLPRMIEEALVNQLSEAVRPYAIVTHGSLGLEFKAEIGVFNPHAYRDAAAGTGYGTLIDVNP